MFYGEGNLQYELLPDWAGLPQGWSMPDVCGLAVDHEDNVYILNRSEHPIIVLDREGRFLRTWGEGFFKRAHGSCIAPDGTVFCTDDSSNVVGKFSPSGELLMMLGARGQSSDTGYVHAWDLWQGLGSVIRSGPPFNRPTGVAISADGDIFVTDGYGNARVHRFDASGRLQLSWGEPGGGPGQFRLPHDIAIDAKGRLLVADRENNRLQLFDQTGTFLEQWTDVIRPTGICIDADGLVYVSELAMRISTFNPDGRLLARWGNRSAEKESALFHGPHVVAVDSRGDLYVGDVSMTHARVDKGANTVQKFRRVR